MYAAGVLDDNGTRALVISDGVNCVAVSQGADFNLITTLNEQLPIIEFKKKYNINDITNATLLPYCKTSVIKVAKNGSYKTRPMRDAAFNKTGNIILIGAPCESEKIKPYSATDTVRGYYFATNAGGFRGLVVCEVSK